MCALRTSSAVFATNKLKVRYIYSDTNLYFDIKMNYSFIYGIIINYNERNNNNDKNVRSQSAQRQRDTVFVDGKNNRNLSISVRA